MKHPSTKPTVCRTDKEPRLNPIYHTSHWLLWQQQRCRPLQLPSPFPTTGNVGRTLMPAGSGAGSIHPVVGAGEWCWLCTPLHHLADQGPPVRRWYLTSCSATGLQGQSPDTALGIRNPRARGTPRGKGHHSAFHTCTKGARE